MLDGIRLPIISIAQPYAISRVARISQTELSASVWTRYMYSDLSYYIKTTYTDKKIIREIFDENETAVIEGVRTKIFKALQLNREETHNYGFIPVIFMQNRPKKNFFGGSNLGSFYPDASPVFGLQNFLQDLSAMIKHELEFNRTRAFASLTAQEQNILTASKVFGDYASQKQTELAKKLLSDFIIQTDMGIAGEGGERVKILMADPRFEKYILAMDWAVKMFFRGCGYSSDDDSSGGDKTAFELAVNQSDDVETTRIKRTYRQNQYKRLFKKIFLMLGADEQNVRDENFTFEIKENIIIDRMKELQLAETRIQMGVSSRVREIQKIYGVSKEEAESLLQEIDGENESDEWLKMQEPMKTDEGDEPINDEIMKESNNENKPAESKDTTNQ